MPATAHLLYTLPHAVAGRDAPGTTARELLGARRLRRTVARSMVLDALLHRSRLDEPFTPLSIAAQLAGAGGPIDRATLYRVMATLEGAGLIEPHRPPPGAPHA
jgi:Fe2+ or Zn2+ uptake regulation protein